MQLKQGKHNVHWMHGYIGLQCPAFSHDYFFETNHAGSTPTSAEYFTAPHYAPTDDEVANIYRRLTL